MMTQENEEAAAVEVVEDMSPLKRAMLLKKAQKKARKALEKQGFPKTAASKMIKTAVRNIANRPMKRAAGRGG